MRQDKTRQDDPRLTSGTGYFLALGDAPSTSGTEIDVDAAANAPARPGAAPEGKERQRKTDDRHRDHDANDQS